MSFTEQIILKGLLGNCEEKKRAALLRLMPDSLQAALKEILFTPHLSPRDFSYEHLLNFVHYSWFLPTLKSYQEKERYLLISALDADMAKALLNLLKLQKEPVTITPKGRQFLQQLLLTSLLNKNHALLPMKSLPHSPLNGLLKIARKDVMRVIDLLSVYDLASEMHQIIQPKMIKAIYSILSEDQKKFLKMNSTYKEPYSFMPLELKKLLSSPDRLKKVLHMRGLIRFGQALSIQGKDLIWYTLHYLDIGRAATLEKIMSKKPKQQVAERLVEQILDALEFLKG